MNFHIQAFLPILVAAGANVTVGGIWYSDKFFGPMWRKLGGKSINQNDMAQKIALHAIASVFTATALFIAISVFQKAQTNVYTKEGFLKIFSLFLQDTSQNNSLMSSMKIAGFVWLGFIAPCKAVSSIWGSSSLKKFAIETTGQLVSLVTMAGIIASLS